MDGHDIEILAASFTDIVRGCGSRRRTRGIREEFDKDVARYTEHTRFYHSLEHVKQFLDLIDEHEGSFYEPNLARFAALKHDTFYDVKDTRDNETLSAIDASHTAERLHISVADREQIVRYVLATEHLGNKTRVLTPEEKLFADIDLDGFSRSIDRVIDGSRKVRREYAHLSDDDFWKMHIRFLGQLEMRGFIYQSLEYAGHEQRARENLREIRRSRDSIVSARSTDRVRSWP